MTNEATITSMYEAIEKASKQCGNILNEDITTLNGSSIELWKCDMYQIFNAHLKLVLFGTVE